MQEQIQIQLQGDTKIISIVFVLLPNWMKRAIKKKQRQATLSPPIKTLSHYQIYKKTYQNTKHIITSHQNPADHLSLVFIKLNSFLD